MRGSIVLRDWARSPGKTHAKAPRRKGLFLASLRLCAFAFLPIRDPSRATQQRSRQSVTGGQGDGSRTRREPPSNAPAGP